MTPEERARALLERVCLKHFPPPTLGLMRHECGDCLAAAFRAAENEALERALVAIFDAICDGCGRELHMGRVRDRIRAMKHPEGA